MLNAVLRGSGLGLVLGSGLGQKNLQNVHLRFRNIRIICVIIARDATFDVNCWCGHPETDKTWIQFTGANPTQPTMLLTQPNPTQQYINFQDPTQPDSNYVVNVTQCCQ